MKRKIIALCAMATMSLLFAACGKSEASPDIVGTWIDVESENRKFIFNSDGTWQYAVSYTHLSTVM